MKKYVFILSITTLIFTVLSCTKDGYKTAEQLKYKVEFETTDPSIDPDGTMTIYSNAFDTTMVKSIGSESGSSGVYNWSDIVNWETSSGMKINPDNNTKAKLLVIFRGDVIADIQGDFGEEVKFKKTYSKDEFKE